MLATQEAAENVQQFVAEYTQRTTATSSGEMISYKAPLRMYKCSFDIYQRLKYRRRPGQQLAEYQMSSELGPFSGSLLRFSAVSPIFAFNVFPSRSNDQGEGKRVKSGGERNSNSLGEVA